MRTLLTENLKNSEQYGHKIHEQLKAISNQILLTKLSIGNLKQRIEQSKTYNQCAHLAMKLEEADQLSYKYKEQKIEIKINHCKKNIQLQQQIFQKKNNQQCVLKDKILGLEKQLLKDKISNQQEIDKIQKQVSAITTAAQNQLITIQHLYRQQSAAYKSIRQKQDALSRLRSSNHKKRSQLQLFADNIEPEHNKENEDSNIRARKQQSKKKRQKSKTKIVELRLEKLEKKISSVIDNDRVIDKIWEETNLLEKQFEEIDQLVGDINHEKYAIVDITQLMVKGRQLVDNQ